MARVKILATGGTISSKVNPATGGAAPALTGEELLATIPGLREVAEVAVENIAHLPGFHMHPGLWVTLASRARAALAEGYDGVVITHGTDTMEETAFFLDLTVAGPVVLTGAQRNASYFDPDGPRNLLEAVRVAIHPDAKEQGVMLLFNGKISAARDVTKVHTSHVETFQSGEHGFLGTVELDQVRFYRRRMPRRLFPCPAAFGRVDIIPTYPGHDDLFFRAALDAGAEGIVVQAYGLGNGSPQLQEAVEMVIGRGHPVVVASRVPQGAVGTVYGIAGGGRNLAAAGAIYGHDLSPWKARVLLMLALTQTRDHEQLRHIFRTV